MTFEDNAEARPASFAEWASTRLDAVLRFATVLTNERGLAEDVVQEVLIRAHRRWESIAAMDQPEAYIRRMVVNEFLSWRRKWARIVPTDAEPLAHRQAPEPDHAGADADRVTLRAEIAKLPRQQRAVIALRYFEGLPDREIADVLGCSESTVRGYAFRALKALRVELS